MAEVRSSLVCAARLWVTLLCTRVKDLEKANEAATQRTKRKRKRIQREGTLTKAEGAEIVAQKDVEKQLNEKTREGEARLSSSRQARSRCTRCREQGYNSRTCKTTV